MRTPRGLLCAVAAAWLTGLSWMAPADETDDWPLFGHNYANHRYSTLSEIHSGNVAELELAWRFDTGRKGSFQATPIVSGETMFISTPFNDVIALDAGTGELKWRYVHEHVHENWCCGPANRGIALAHDKIFMATLDSRLVALNRKDGSLAWNVPIVDAEANTAAREVIEPLLGEKAFAGAEVTGATGYSANMAPQVVDGKVLVGVTGAGYGLHLDLDRPGGESLSVVGLSGGANGLRGFLVAYDAQSGEELWRWYSVQGPDWVGDYASSVNGISLNRDIARERARSSSHTDGWRMGGGSIWTTPAVDEKLGHIYIGTGNPAPQMADSTRPGDNRDTVSLVALDLDAGTEIWAYQQVPHDRWGYDVASPPVLFEAHHGGGKVPAVAQASKTGWVFVHDRRSGELLFKSEPFVPQRNLFAPPSEAGTEVAPAIVGGASWSPMAYSGRHSLFFVAGIHHPATYFSKPLEATPERPWESYAYMELSKTERWGTVTAIDASSGSIRWQKRMLEPMLGGVLATAGDLIFTGEGDGHFNAMHAGTGEMLWRHRAPYGVNAPPVSYAIDGTQYVAVAAGGNKLFGFPVGDAILAFALPDRGESTAVE